MTPLLAVIYTVMSIIFMIGSATKNRVANNLELWAIWAVLFAILLSLGMIHETLQ